MPDTPNFAITYPCEGAVVAPADFQIFATDVEAAVATVDAEGQVVTHLPFAVQRTTTTPLVNVSTVLVFVASAFNFSSGVTVGVNTFTAVTPGLYQATAQMNLAVSSLTLTSFRLGILRNGVLAYASKRQGITGVPIAAQGNITGAVQMAVGDTVSFSALWTGSGVLTPFDASVSIDLLSTP